MNPFHWFRGFHVRLRPGKSRGLRRAIPVLVSFCIAWIAAGGHDFAESVQAADRIAGFAPRVYAITGARLVVRPGESIESGTIVIRDGLITHVGKKIKPPADAEVIDAPGYVVYPGFIDAGTTALVDADLKVEPVAGREVDFERYVLAATRPDNRHLLTPEFHIDEGLARKKDDLEKFRRAGFVAVHVLPHGRIASGAGTVVSTNDAPLREAVIVPASFATFRLFNPGGSEYPATLMGATAHLRQAFLDAERDALHHELYEKRTPGVERPVFDECLATLTEVRSGDRRAIFSATTRDDIHRALDFADEFGLSPAIWGGKEAYRAIDRLTAEKVDVILRTDFGDRPELEPRAATDELRAEIEPPLRVQQARLDRWKKEVGVAAALEQTDLRYAFGSRDLDDPSKLLQGVRQAIQEGLTPQGALAGLTTNPAKLLGLEDRLGTLEKGKAAHLVVLNGPLEEDEAVVRWLFVDGRKYEYNESAKPIETSPDEGPQPLDVAGRWRVVIESATGKVPGTLELAQDGKRITGRFTSEDGSGRVASGSVDEENLKFSVLIGAGDRAVQLAFSGKFEDDKLVGELKSPFGAPTSWSAHRADDESANSKNSESTDPKSETQNPVRIELAENDADSDPNDPSKDETSAAAEYPTELEADRLRRSIETGGNVLVRGGTVITGTGKTLPKTSILVKDGMIAAIGANLKPDEGMTVIDAAGRFVMPGIIDTHSHTKITGGVNEYTQSIVPEVRVKDVVDTSDIAEYRALAGGVTTARLLHGSANVIGGQDAVVRLKYGAPAGEQIIDDAPQGVKFALGENVKRRRNRFPNTRLGVEATLNRAFLEAIDYRRHWDEFRREKKQGDSPALPPRRDLRLEALADIVQHEKFIHCHCYRADEILMLLRTARGLGIRVWSLQHVLEGYKIAPEIVAHGASCSTFADWWAYKVEAFDATPFNAALLHEAGANVVVKSDNDELIRHLNQEAAKTIRYGGLPADEALCTITRNSARELGLLDRMGTIEVGKYADLAIFNAHPLNAFSRCEITLVGGEAYYVRDGAPTVMSEKQRKRSARPTKLELPGDEIRALRLDLAPQDDGRYAITNATLHPVDGPPIAGGTIVVADGKIAALGKNVAPPTGAKVIEARGLHVYPGLIDSGTTLGLSEIDKVRETRDFAETGELQPDIRAGVGVNVDSELIPVARCGGVTAILIRPKGSLIGGQASIVQLAGWTSEDMVLEYETALSIDWPEGKNSKKQRAKLQSFFEKARAYDRIRTAAEKGKADGPMADPRLEAMQPYLDAKKPVLFEANTRRQIAEALLFAEKWKLRPIITGGRDAWKLADELKKRDVPVIVGPVMSAPAENDPLDAPYANPGRLYEAGVKFCIRSDSAWNSRNVPFEAGIAVAFGLPEEQAIRAVTLSAAEILGVDAALGSLTVGKRANLLITDGSPLQPTSQVKGVFIAGRPFAPESRQTRFYERYRRRLHEYQEKQNSGKLTTSPGK